MTVTDVKEAPTNIALSNSSIAENAGANAPVGALSATEPDTTPKSFPFTLPSGLNDNAAFNVAPDGVTLRANASFNFEAQSSYTVTVRVTDQIGRASCRE